MASVLADTARRFARAIVMPNLKPPLRTTQQALHYRERILAELPDDVEFEPLMTLYLTDDTPPEEIARAKLSGRVHGVKLYPAGATTHSDAGVTRLSRCFRTLEKMAELVGSKKITDVSDIRDESDRDGMRIVVELKRDGSPHTVMQQLFKHTTLQTSFSANVLALVDGQPQTLGLKRMLEHYIS